MTDLDAPIRAMFDATNAGDSEAFIAAFAPDAVLIDWGRTFTGLDEIAVWNANENIGVQAHIETTTLEHHGEDVVVGVQVSGNGYNGGGSFAFRTAAGKITRMEIRG